MSIKNKYIVEKSNIFNEIRGNNMSLQELRFFSIYLSKINARDVSTRCVRFPLSDFQKIMGFGRLNIKQIQKSTNKLLCKVVNVPNKHGGYTGFTIFKRVRVFKDDFETWVIEIDASDDALPFLFNLKGNYFTYELWNALRLNSVNQLRMYELLKQRERFGNFEIKVSELREYLYISPEKYPHMDRFKDRVLNSCQEALAENTDICYTYECGKRGPHGKWLTIVFHISKNNKFVDPLELHKFMDEQPEPQSEPQSEDTEPIEEQNCLSGELETDLMSSDLNALRKELIRRVPAEERTQELLMKRLQSIYTNLLANNKDALRDPLFYLLNTVLKMPTIPPKDVLYEKWQR